MSFEAMLFLIATGVALVASTVLVFYKDFDDKVLGRIGLVFIILSSVAVLHDFYVSGQAFVWARTALVFTIGTAFLLVRLCLAHFLWWRERRHQRSHRRRGDSKALF